jgi:tetratricopeptide (TPR) repeat protein
MKKLIFFIIVLLFLSSCVTSTKTEKKVDEKKEVRGQNIEPIQKDEEKKDDGTASSQESNNATTVTDVALQHPPKNNDTISSIKKEEKKEIEITPEIKVEINSEINGFLKLEGKERLSKIDELLKKYPQSDILYYYKAKFYYDIKDNENSLFNVNLSLKINPENTYALDIMFAIFLKENPKKAEDLLLSQLRKFPDSYKIMLFAARGYYALSKYAKVIYIAKEILKLNQNNKEALKLLALGYYFSDSKDLAFYVISKVDELMYQIPELIFIKGLILYENKSLKLARDSFEEAFTLNPNLFEAGNWLAYIDYKVSLKLKDKEAKEKLLISSESIYKKIINLKKDFLVYMNYGLVLYELNKNDDALMYFLESEKLNNKNYSIYYNLGILYLMRNLKDIKEIDRYDLAIKCFNDYNKLLPKKDLKKKNANSLITEAQTLKAVAQAKQSSKEEELKNKEDAVKDEGTASSPNKEEMKDKEEDAGVQNIEPIQKDKEEIKDKEEDARVQNIEPIQKDKEEIKDKEEDARVQNIEPIQKDKEAVKDKEEEAGGKNIEPIQKEEEKIEEDEK